MSIETATLLELIGQFEDAVLIVDREGVIVFRNPAANQIFDTRPPNEPTTLLDLFGETQRLLLAQQISNVENGIATNEPLLFSHGATNEDLKILKLRVARFSATSDCYALHVRDVTEMYANEQELRRVQKEFTFAQRVTQIGTWSWNVKTGELNWSDESYRLLGLEPGSTMPTAEVFLEFVHQDDRHKIAAQMDNLLRFDKFENLDYRVVHPNGEIHYLHSIPAIPDPHEQHIYFGTAQNVTQRKLTELHLERLYRELDVITRSIPDVIFTIDRSGHVKWGNENFIRLFTNRNQHSQAMHIADIFSPADLEQVQSKIVLCQSIKQCDARVSFAVGDQDRTFHLKLALIDHPTNSEIIVVARDIHDYELLQTQLRQSQKMEALGHFTGGVAHDFNNILAIIMGFTSLARTQADPDNFKLKEYLDEVFGASERARDLIKKLLMFSRGTQSAPQAIKLAPTVKKTSTLLKSILPATIEIQTAANQDDVTVLVDAVQLEHAIINLCLNAKDAMNAKGVISIRMLPNTPVNDICTSCQTVMQGEFTVLEIEDQGHGIPHEKLQRIFEPFYTTKPIGKGSGMGLPMVHGIIHEYKGHVTVHSQAGKGSRFRLLLPAVRESELA